MLPILVLGSGCDQQPETDASILAEVGGVPIRIADLEAERARRRETGRPVLSRHELIQDMIRLETLYQKARREGLDQDAEYRREIRNLLVGRLQAGELQPRIDALEVSDEEVRDVYEAEQERFVRPARKEVAIIRMDGSGRGGERDVTALQDRMEEALKFARIHGFGKAAGKFSEDQASRYQAGRIGWVIEGRPHARLPETVREELSGMGRKGSISRAIRAGDSWYALQLLDTMSSTILPFEEVAPGIRRRLLADKTRALQEAFMEACESELSVIRFEDRWGPEDEPGTGDPDPPGPVPGVSP